MSLRPCTADTTRLLALSAAAPDRFPHLLISGGGGRFDILFAYPEAPRVLAPGARADEAVAFFGSIARGARRCAAGDTKIPFCHGDFLYFSYELAGVFEPRLRLPQSALPLAFAQYCRGAIVFDHVSGRSFACGEDAGLAGALAEEAEGVDLPSFSAVVVGDVQEDDGRAYCDGIQTVKEYIAAGDVFQVNLSRGYEGRVAKAASSAALMAALCDVNPAPFSALASIGETRIVSASPERLVEVRKDHISTSPIAGTAPRGASAQSDRSSSRRLKMHPKERAEHIMLVDLERNDLGRICVPGSVKVSSLMGVESYATVHHLVSTVEGRLPSGIALADILRGLFPGGSITGCPKVRCMEIIAELEETSRGAYTGSLGYLNEAGDLTLNILIRTAVLQGDTLSFRVGAGIVADSDPRRELAETRAKAEGLLRAFCG